MSLSLLTNQSATMATNDLSSVSAKLQRSLNRLSSGSKIVSPADDAGGLAVSMKMSSAIKRQAAASNNLSNAISYLQTQDGALESTNQILSRISELKVLSQDVTKNASDKANYNTEYAALKEQLIALSDEKFNGISLFSSQGMSVKTGVDGSNSSVTIGGANLLGDPALFADSFSGNTLGSDWTVNSGSPTVSSGVLKLDGSRITLNESFSEPVSVSMDIRLDNFSDVMDVYNDANYYFANFIDGTEVPDTDWHTLTFDLDTDGTMSGLKLDGSDFSSATGTVVTTSGAISLGLYGLAGGDGIEFRNLSINGANSSGATEAGSVSQASSLDALDISTLKEAIEEVSTLRAENGAQQSRLHFARDQLDSNMANLEAANSRIVDVDVAAESTQLARFNILQQAGASMLSQANQSQQVALKLLS